MTPTITRNADLCVKCGTCVLTCRASVYVQETKGSIPEVINPGSWISCDHCVALCPRNAIVHSEFPEGYVLEEVGPCPSDSAETIPALPKGQW